MIGRVTEQLAETVKEFYGLPPMQRVLPDVLAEHMPVEFASPGELRGLSPDLLADLEGKHSSRWDAATLPEPIRGRYVILVNGTKAPTRLVITRMEELLHIHFGHKPTQLLVDSQDPVSLCARTYNKEHEDQAYSVGAALLVPWRQIYWDVFNGQTIVKIATALDVSEQLVRYRINVTGLSRLYSKKNKALS